MIKINYVLLIVILKWSFLVEDLFQNLKIMTTEKYLIKLFHKLKLKT